MATVYLARLTGVGGFQRFVAIKRLHPHLATEREFVEMFLDEARLAAGIHHPNVVAILEVGANAVGYYLVMEYVEGDTLARLLARASSKGQRMPAAITLRIALDLLAGLHAAHDLRDDHGQTVNLVHRDVSPQNVLVGSDGITRITDFGVARATSRLSATRVGQLKGKIAYMAPEQARGDERLDRRADVFAAGIVIWEALTGRRLFKAENEAATLSRILSESPPSLESVAPELGSAVSDVVMKALARDRDERFATTAAFADALEAAAADSPSLASLASSRELAAYVQEAMGEEIARQREAIRAWVMHSESLPADATHLSGVINPSSSVSAASMSLPDLSRRNSDTTLADGPRKPRAPMLALFALLLFGGSLGGYAGVRLLRGNAPSSAAGEGTQVARPAPPARAAASADVSAPAAELSSPVQVEASAASVGEQPPVHPSAVPPTPVTEATATVAPRPSRVGGTPPRARKRKPDDEVPPNPYRN